MIPNPFLNAQGRLRNGWWVAIFFAILTALLFPLILISNGTDSGVPLYQQLAVIMAASVLCQMLRRRPVSELTGRLDGRWLSELIGGSGLGFLLMAAPAALLAISGAVTWSVNSGWSSMLGPTLLTLLVAAAAEELLFRGFLFQRLLAGLGVWPAQLIIAGLFALTHSDALRELGDRAYLATANIFLASLLFGFAYLRTRSLALPLGLHFAANATQGPLFGFGVSGGEQVGVLTPAYDGAFEWLTGGSFGLEASVPGFVCVVFLSFLLWRWRGRAQD